MPALPPVAGVVDIVYDFTVGLDTNVTTRAFTAYTGGAPNNGDCQAIANHALSAASANFPAAMGADVTLNFVTVTDLSSPSGGRGVSGGAAVTGTRTGGLLPAATCALINYTIGRRYRGGKPRSYFPFGTDADLTNAQTWTAGALTAFFDAVAGQVSGVEGFNTGSTTVGRIVNVSYYNGFTNVTNPITGRTKAVAKLRAAPIVDAIASITANPKPGSQRRRYQRH